MAHFWCLMECFRINSIWLYILPYGVLHTVTFWWYMEYSMWSLFPAVWSASYDCHPCQLWKKCKELHKTCFQCSMEYSIWPWITAIWSTPYGASLMPYGVLYNYLLMNITKVIWCTPYGHFFMPYGVLHVVTISCHMECFISLPSMSIVEEMQRAP